MLSIMVDKETYRSVMRNFAIGVTIVTSAQDGVPHGMTATAIASVSLEPTLVLFCAEKTTRTHEMICQSKVFAINFLREGMNELSDRFAGRIGSEDERFDDLEYHSGQTGAPILKDSIGWLECRMIECYDGGDHSIFLGEVVDGAAGEGDPLVFFRGNYASVLPEAMRT